MAALALLMTLSCSMEDTNFDQQLEDNGEITITATLSADDGVMTRALAFYGIGGYIFPEWEATDQFAILYNDGTKDTKSIATVLAINEKSVSITFSVPSSLPNNTICSITYPASAANTSNFGPPDVNAALATQKGVLATAPDVRWGGAFINMVDRKLDMVTQLEARHPIFKFTLQNFDGEAKCASEFKVSDNSGHVITTVTPEIASSELYVSLPVMAAGTYWFNATVDGKPFIAKATLSAETVAGKYYQTTVKMATIGDDILPNGKFAKAGTSGAKARINYLGSNTESYVYNHGLALALSDVGWYIQSSTEAYNHIKAWDDDGNKAISGATWRLPSRSQWNAMINAAGGYAALRDSNGLSSENKYWSSSGWGDGSGDIACIGFASGYWVPVPNDANWVRTRACLIF